MPGPCSLEDIGHPVTGITLQLFEVAMLFEFITLHREEIITRRHAKVATREFPPPSPREINHGGPVFLDQLSEALRLGETSRPDIGISAIKHGHDLLEQGFTV